MNHTTDPREVHEAIRKLKTDKAHSTDGILADRLKVAGETAVQLLTKLFNVLFDEGVYPEEWSKAIIVPIFKKGSENIIDNYRGIPLLRLISKCYTSVLKTKDWSPGQRKMGSCWRHKLGLDKVTQRPITLLH